MVEVSMQLDIIADKVVIPGCEPTSAMTSNKLNAMLEITGCTKGALVDVDAVLEAIPGSYVKVGTNWGVGNMRKKWLVFPPRTPNCPCDPNEDWYGKLRDLVTEEVEVIDRCAGESVIAETSFCEVISGQPDTEQDPYGKEGEFSTNYGVLPPVPPWMRK